MTQTASPGRRAPGEPELYRNDLVGARLRERRRALFLRSRAADALRARFSLDADVGGDFGRVSQDFDDFTAGAALVYEIAAPLRLIASFSQGFRAPNLDDTVVLRTLPD